MIIDCHTHLNHYKDESVQALPKTLENLQREMKRNRVDFSLILTSYIANPGRPSTRDVVKAIRPFKNLYVVAGISFLNYTKEDLSELREYIKEGVVRGLKFYCGYEPFYPSDPRMLPAVELAKEHNIPIMIHSGDTFSPKGRLKYSHPLHIDDLAVDHPTLTIIVCHLGSPWFKDCMEVIYKNSNVYTDISGLVLGEFDDRFQKYMQNQLQEMLIYGVEPEKVLYGSDWPIASMSAYLKFIDELRIPERDKKKILYGNSAKLFKLKPEDSPLKKGSLFSWLK